ncbi:HD-GYP domain-containing protein [Desulfuribacillus alkaliarsenatis]|uniref:Uncharacterized protein n=1 Tax=Desulfuribacillus alkaliarsenatis TaxID=766136 RepID=A0A1E5G331_9FIRM|nr:HD domain-containing phosphohydrolase [Desulfuribacillus alkaliarsenatis]OEF97002.1 hypothetical protein BHF68_05215 [Desulfuribacillus alkaliarsenatis]
MIYVSIDNIQYGTILARNIYNDKGDVLLKKGTPLTVGLLARLRRLGVYALYVENEHFNDIEMEDAISEQTKIEALTSIALAIEKTQAGKDFDIKNISKAAKNIVADITEKNDILVSLNDIRTKDNQLFVHSLNVCMLSVLMGLKLELNNMQLNDLAVGALLHDIGLGNYENEEVDKSHALKGFSILKKKHEINLLSAHVALQHHENVDGSGYPRGMKGPEIPLYAKIVAVADYFDRRMAAGDVKPYEACEEIMGYTGKRFDINIVVLFLKSVALYPTGSSVQLTTGDTGVVISQHPGIPMRPKVRLLKTKSVSSSDYDEESLLSEDTETFDVDLYKKTTVFIKSILNE